MNDRLDAKEIVVSGGASNYASDNVLDQSVSLVKRSGIIIQETQIDK